MRIVFLLLFQTLVLIESALSFQLNHDVKQYLFNSLNENFYNFTLSKNAMLVSKYDDYSQNLKSFQHELVKKRNLNCQYEELKFKHFNLTDKNNILINLFDSLSKSEPYSHDFNLYTMKIVQFFNDTCISSDSLIDLFVDKTNYENDFKNLLKIVLTQTTNFGCDICNQKKANSQPITRLETWGYGVLFVGLISLSSLCGAVVIPFSNKKIYKKILMVLIAIAIGSLAGSGLLHLIPQAYGITEDEKYSGNHAYVWKSLTIMFGIYLFYLVEKFMKLMIQRRNTLKKNSYSLKKPRNKSTENENPVILESIGYLKAHDAKLDPNVEMRMHLSEEALANSRSAERRNNHGHSHGLDNLSSVAPVAWMIIFGDGLHNFIDGLSIGAAFTESIFKGISICLAVMCEEFPHELGDFAILINSGMSYPVALFFNFLSACCCFVGLAVGIQLGENLGANQWIYAIAGGMFLYISLCGMIPELNEMGEEIERDYLNEKYSIGNDERRTLSQNGCNDSKRGEESTEDITQIFDFAIKLKIIFLQNLGILFGFGFMLFMAIYSEIIAI